MTIILNNSSIINSQSTKIECKQITTNFIRLEGVSYDIPIIMNENGMVVYWDPDDRCWYRRGSADRTPYLTLSMQ